MNLTWKHVSYLVWSSSIFLLAHWEGLCIDHIYFRLWAFGRLHIAVLDTKLEPMLATPICVFICSLCFMQHKVIYFTIHLWSKFIHFYTLLKFPLLQKSSNPTKSFLLALILYELSFHCSYFMYMFNMVYASHWEM